MKPVRFHDAARIELLNEVRYYTGISPKLGERLAIAVEQATQLASEFPEAEVYIVAVAPFRRKPDYWRARAK